MTRNIKPAQSILKPPPRGWHNESWNGPRDYYLVRNGFTVAKCPGEAHSNPHIDNCSLCAPLWGVIAVKDE